jgi:hypothetical protein
VDVPFLEAEVAVASASYDDSGTPECQGKASPRLDPQVQARVKKFVLKQYAGGRSLREPAS